MYRHVSINGPLFSLHILSSTIPNGYCFGDTFSLWMNQWTQCYFPGQSANSHWQYSHQSLVKESKTLYVYIFDYQNVAWISQIRKKYIAHIRAFQIHNEPLHCAVTYMYLVTCTYVVERNYFTGYGILLHELPVCGCIFQYTPDRAHMDKISGINVMKYATFPWSNSAYPKWYTHFEKWFSSNFQTVNQLRGLALSGNCTNYEIWEIFRHTWTHVLWKGVGGLPRGGGALA